MRYEYNLQKPAFTVKNIDLINLKRAKNYRHSYRNGRSKHGFIYIVEGSIDASFFNSDEEVISASQGELLFIPQGSKYTSIYTSPLTHIQLIQFDIDEGALNSYLSRPVKIELPDAGEILNRIFSKGNSHSLNHPFYYLSCLYELLYRIDETYGRLPRKYKKLGQALYELSERYEKNESVGYYAELCDMSEVHFRRLFKEYTGLSPIEYRNELRLQNARAKLKSGEYNVSETAESCGFSNLSFFINLYKKRFGHTPKQE